MISMLSLPGVGFVVGVLIGMTGIGGGAMMTPILILGFGLPATTAVGTDLFYATLTKMVGAAQHLGQGTVDSRVVRLLAVGSLPACLMAVGGLAWLYELDAAIVERIVRTAIALSLVLAALLIARRVVVAETGRFRSSPMAPRSRWVVGIGALGGLLVGLSSVGSGSLIIALLVMGGFVSDEKLVGTDITHAVLLVGVAAAAHFTLGHVDLGLAALLLLGSVPGVMVGSRTSTRMPIRYVQAAIGVLLILTAVQMIR